MSHEAVSGALNAVAPEPVTNARVRARPRRGARAPDGAEGAAVRAAPQVRLAGRRGAGREPARDAGANAGDRLWLSPPVAARRARRTCWTSGPARRVRAGRRPPPRPSSRTAPRRSRQAMRFAAARLSAGAALARAIARSEHTRRADAEWRSGTLRSARAAVQSRGGPTPRRRGAGCARYFLAAAVGCRRWRRCGSPPVVGRVARSVARGLRSGGRGRGALSRRRWRCGAWSVRCTASPPAVAIGDERRSPEERLRREHEPRDPDAAQLGARAVAASARRCRGHADGRSAQVPGDHHPQRTDAAAVDRRHPRSVAHRVGAPRDRHPGRRPRAARSRRSPRRCRRSRWQRI